MKYEAWEGFIPGKWCEENEVDTRSFIQKNYTPYEGDGSFLAGPTEATKKLWATVLDLFAQEREKGGVLDAETESVSQIDAYKTPGYIDKDLE